MAHTYKLKNTLRLTKQLTLPDLAYKNRNNPAEFFKQFSEFDDLKWKHAVIKRFRQYPDMMEWLIEYYPEKLI